jgi:hypothetical protein
MLLYHTLIVYACILTYFQTLTYTNMHTGLNAIVAGSDDGKPWVEYLQADVGVPPNLRDCQWRLQPPPDYVEAGKLEKLLKKSDWDAGKHLPIPKTPHPGDDIDELAENILKKHNLGPKKLDAVRDLLIALRMKKEEQEGNALERDRQRGTDISFGRYPIETEMEERYLIYSKQRVYT